MQIKWLTKQQAAARLQVSERRIEQLVTQRSLTAEKRRNPEGGRDTLYLDAGSVERYGALKHAERATGSTALAKQAMAALELGALRERSEQTEISSSDWLTLAQAATYLREIPAETLLDLIVRGRLPALRVRGTKEKRRAIDCYRVKRADLDALAGERYGALAARAAEA